MKRFLCQTDFANEIQPRDLKFGRMPEFIEALKGRTQDASWLGGAIVAKVKFCKNQMNLLISMMLSAAYISGYEKLPD